MWRAKEFTNDRCCHRIYLFHKVLFSPSAAVMDNHVLFPEQWQFLRDSTIAALEGFLFHEPMSKSIYMPVQNTYRCGI